MNLLTGTDILFAASLALILTYMVKILGRLFRRSKPPTEFGFKPSEIHKVIEKCVMLFPRPNMAFGGSVLGKGMLVRVTTVNKRSFEGIFIGTNNDNMICILTGNLVKIDLLDNIAEVVILSPGNSNMF